MKARPTPLIAKHDLQEGANADCHAAIPMKARPTSRRPLIAKHELQESANADCKEEESANAGAEGKSANAGEEEKSAKMQKRANAGEEEEGATAGEEGKSANAGKGEKSAKRQKGQSSGANASKEEVQEAKSEESNPQDSDQMNTEDTSDHEFCSEADAFVRNQMPPLLDDEIMTWDPYVCSDSFLHCRK